MIITREGSKDKWVYKDNKGNILKNKEILEYIKGLVIPPAYHNVRIYYEKSPKILYDGLDDKNRLQQIYSKQWREQADKAKFKALIDFGKKLPQMTLKMLEHIKSPQNSKEKLISIILRITSLCGFRIGQLKYHKLYNSVGLSTLQKKHLKFTSAGLDIKFIGKKGMLNECIVDDKLLIEEIKKIATPKKPDDFLFTYDFINSENVKELRIINAIDVNNWLKYYNPEFTTKYFRTFEVNDKLIEALKKTEPSKMSLNQRKKAVIEVIKDVSCSINNTPAICKKSYINQDILKMYLEHPKKYHKQLIDNEFSSRVNFIKFLESLYK
jgi:DNA topoisomerase-1